MARTAAPSRLRQPVWVLILLPMALALAKTPQVTAHGLDEPFPLVLTPSRLPQRLDEAPSAVTVIDRELIEASGARRIIDVLRLVPGFQVGTKHNSLPTAAYHGLADEFARRLLLLVDGQRIFQYSRGVIEWNNIPIKLEDIERIEVIRGPNAAAYGSNAFEAVVNLQTASAAEYNGLFARVNVGDDQIADGFLRYGGRWGALNYALSLSTQGDSGYDNLSDTRRNYTVSLLGETPIAGRGELKVRASYSRGNYDFWENELIVLENAQFEDTFAVTDNFQSLQWWQPLGKNSEWKLSLSHNRFYYGDRGYRSDQIIPGLTLEENREIEETRYTADLDYLRRFSNRFRVVTGLGFHHERVTSPAHFATEETLDNDVFRVFGHGEYRLSDDWIINLGLMAERSQLSRQWLWLPRLSLHVHLNDHHTLRAIYSTGSRQPTLYESRGRNIVRDIDAPLVFHQVYASGERQGGLDPERNQSFEIGYFWQPNRRTSLDIRLVQEQLSDLVVAFYRPETQNLTLSPQQLVLDFDNENNITIRALEAQWDWQSRSGTRIFASYAFTEVDAAGTRYNLGFETSVPRHSAGVLISQTWDKGWQGSLNYQYQSDLQWYLDEPIDAYHRLDARVARRIPAANGRATVALVATHLLGPISDYLPDQTWDRGVFLQFTFER